MALQQYDYTVEYRAGHGRVHNNADAMSRRDCEPTTENMKTDDLPHFQNMLVRVTATVKSKPTLTRREE